MTQEEADMLTLAMCKALQQSRSVSDSEHYDDHMYLKAKREKEKKRTEFYEDMIRHLAKWSLIGLFLYLIGALGLGLKQTILGWLGK